MDLLCTCFLIISFLFLLMEFTKDSMRDYGLMAANTDAGFLPFAITGATFLVQSAAILVIKFEKAIGIFRIF